MRTVHQKRAELADGHRLVRLVLSKPGDRLVEFTKAYEFQPRNHASALHDFPSQIKREGVRE